jgi:hypothetical protein
VLQAAKLTEAVADKRRESVAAVAGRVDLDAQSVARFQRRMAVVDAAVRSLASGCDVHLYKRDWHAQLLVMQLSHVLAEVSRGCLHVPLRLQAFVCCPLCFRSAPHWNISQRRPYALDVPAQVWVT